MVGNHLWRCTEILKLTVERYLGFNHAAITEMGLLIGLLLQGQATIAKKSSSKLLEALEDSTLTDGMWAERSPSYHIHMLVLADCLRAMTDPSSSEYLRIDVLTSLMRSALAAFVHPDGEIAIFNDAAIADAPEPSAVGWSACDSVETIVLPTAGFAKVVRAGTTVIMDAGPMGPDAVIGHGHADFLSVEVSVGGKRLIVDPGVAATSAGADREWTRSAESHNGPTLAGAQPAEFFGAWRVGRRGTAWFDQVTTDEFGATSITATCDGYTRWGVTVTRELIVERDGKLTINDRWAGNTHRDPLLSFLIYGIWTVHQATDQAVLLVHAGGDRVTMAVSGGKIAGVEQSRMFLKGPMNPESATCLRVRPDGQYVTTVLDPHHR